MHLPGRFAVTVALTLLVVAAFAGGFYLGGLGMNSSLLPASSAPAGTPSTTQTTTVTSMITRIPSLVFATARNSTIRGNISDIAYLPAASEVLVTHGPDPELSVLNEADGVVSEIALQEGASSVVVDPATAVAYLADSCGQTACNASISQVDLGRGVVSGSLHLGVRVTALAIDPGVNLLLATQRSTSGSGGYVLFLSLPSGRMVGNASVDGVPTALAVNSLTHSAYVSTCQVSQLCLEASVSALSEAGMDVTGRADLGLFGGTPSMAVSEATDTIYLMAQPSVVAALRGSDLSLQYEAQIDAFPMKEYALAVNPVQNLTYSAGTDKFGSWFYIQNGVVGGIINGFWFRGVPVRAVLDAAAMPPALYLAVNWSSADGGYVAKVITSQVSR